MKRVQFSGVLASDLSSSDARSVDADHLLSGELLPPALLASRFNGLNDFKEHIQIDYLRNGTYQAEVKPDNVAVRLSYTHGKHTLISELPEGIRQEEISKALEGGIREKIRLVFKSPFVIRHRNELNQVHKLSRRRPAFFGEGDLAFYDLALASVSKINTPDLAYLHERDSSEKGFINTFNHVTAQALMTAILTEDVTNFVAAVHERENMPELTHGLFTQEQLNSPDNNPVDNYVDMINNELGQRLGLALRHKYRIMAGTPWSAQLLADCLNELQRYYAWSFGIGMEPFDAEEPAIRHFAQKINIVAAGVPYEDK